VEKRGEAHLDSIDLVKGCAILWVFLIHSQALGDTRSFRHVVNQAVPIFIVLFGVNSELWWRRHTGLGEWYAGRVRRILVPMWAALPVWWAFALYWRPLTVTLTRTLPLWQFAGYLAEVGTGWFITMIIQLVVVFPLLHATVRRWGPLPLVVGIAVTIACAVFQYPLMPPSAVFGPLPGEDRQQFLNFCVFAPRFLGTSRWASRSRLTCGGSVVAGAVALVVYLGVVLIARALGRLAPAGDVLTGLPLTVFMLAAFNLAPRVPIVTPVFVWLGQSSYGLYLGQLLTHNAFVFALGIGLYGTLNLWLYTVVLLVSALFFVALGEGLLRLVEALRRGGLPLPSLAR
jgi:peptidoglycan/LPS O-acetylase OafA/YrhL